VETLTSGSGRARGRNSPSPITPSEILYASRFRMRWTPTTPSPSAACRFRSRLPAMTFSRATATWKAPTLPAGTYAVYATWAPLTNGLTTEPYTITKTDATGASQTTTSAPMNFRLAPGGLDYDSAKWTQIGTVTSTGTETVSVTLSTGSTNSGTIPADAILFKPTGLDVARTTYEWDHQNRLTKVTNESAAFSATGVMTLSPRDTTTYAYDVLGRRAAVTYDLVGPADGGGNFRRVSVYDGSQVVWTETGTNREQMVSQGTTQAMLWAPGTDQLLAIQERLGGTGAVKQPVWTLTDHQGTVKDYLAKAPTAGAESGLLLTRRYSAFGTPVAAKVWSTLPIADFTDIGGKSGFFYVGQEYDATTGLQYSRARYYDPVSSEFISQDPLGFAGGDTNLYRRAGNSPVNATDPSGMIGPLPIIVAIGLGFFWTTNPANAPHATDRTDPPDDTGFVAGVLAPLALARAPAAAAVPISVLPRVVSSPLVVRGVTHPLAPLAVPLAEGVVEGALGYEGPGLFPWSQATPIDDAGRFLVRGLPVSVPRSTLRTTDQIYGGVRQASKYLQEMGVSRAKRVEYLQAFENGTISLRQAGASEYGLRYFGGRAKPEGSWLFETFPASRQTLALDPG
jgi:RHS repeat-associated protein